MKMKYSTIIVLYAFFSFINCIEIDDEEEDAKKHDCDKLISEVADGNGKFTYCLIKHAVPISVCVNCLDAFNYLTEKYNYTYSNKTCREIFFNNDRLNIIENTYFNSKAIWDKAFCEGCSSNETKQTKDDIIQVDECIQKYNKTGEICEICRNFYETANTNFNKLSKKNGGTVCYDVQDVMNRTRIRWSKELKCNERKANLNAFIVTSSILSILPILFYGGIIIYLKRRRNYIEALNTDFETENNRSTSRLISQSSASQPPQPEPSTSFGAEEEENEHNNSNIKNRKNNSKRKDNSDEEDKKNDDDGDDDDILD